MVGLGRTHGAFFFFFFAKGNGYILLN